MTVKNFKNNKSIQIVYALNDKYVPLAITSMISVAENTKSDINFNIFHSGLSEKSKKYLNSIKKYKNSKIVYQEIDEKKFIKAGVSLKSPYSPVELYFKMIIADILNEYDKVIFLDSDTLCLGDIKELFDIDISGVLLAAVQDAWSPAGKKEFSLRSNRYFNCGTMLLNCKKMRETDFSKRALKYLKDNSSKESTCTAEKILNQMADEDKILLPLKFNYLESWWNNHICYTGNKLVEYNEAKKNPFIIHFTGYKPNTIYNLHSYRETWWLYAKKTPCYIELLETFRNDGINYINNIQAGIEKHQKILDEIKNKVAI